MAVDIQHHLTFLRNELNQQLTEFINGTLPFKQLYKKLSLKFHPDKYDPKEIGSVFFNNINAKLLESVRGASNIRRIDVAKGEELRKKLAAPAEKQQFIDAIVNRSKTDLEKAAAPAGAAPPPRAAPPRAAPPPAGAPQETFILIQSDNHPRYPSYLFSNRDTRPINNTTVISGVPSTLLFAGKPRTIFITPLTEKATEEGPVFLISYYDPSNLMAHRITTYGYRFGHTQPMLNNFYTTYNGQLTLQMLLDNSITSKILKTHSDNPLVYLPNLTEYITKGTPTLRNTYAQHQENIARWIQGDRAGAADAAPPPRGAADYEARKAAAAAEQADRDERQKAANKKAEEKLKQRRENEEREARARAAAAEAARQRAAAAEAEAARQRAAANRNRRQRDAEERERRVLQARVAEEAEAARQRAAAVGAEAARQRAAAPGAAVQREARQRAAAERERLLAEARQAQEDEAARQRVAAAEEEARQRDSAMNINGGKRTTRKNKKYNKKTRNYRK